MKKFSFLLFPAFCLMADTEYMCKVMHNNNPIDLKIIVRDKAQYSELDQEFLVNELGLAVSAINNKFMRPSNNKDNDYADSLSSIDGKTALNAYFNISHMFLFDDSNNIVAKMSTFANFNSKLKSKKVIGKEDYKITEILAYDSNYQKNVTITECIEFIDTVNSAVALTQIPEEKFDSNVIKTAHSWLRNNESAALDLQKTLKELKRLDMSYSMLSSMISSYGQAQGENLEAKANELKNKIIAILSGLKDTNTQNMMQEFIKKHHDVKTHCDQNSIVNDSLMIQSDVNEGEENIAVNNTELTNINTTVNHPLANTVLSFHTLLKGLQRDFEYALKNDLNSNKELVIKQTDACLHAFDLYINELSEKLNADKSSKLVTEATNLQKQIQSIKSGLARSSKLNPGILKKNITSLNNDITQHMHNSNNALIDYSSKETHENMNNMHSHLTKLVGNNFSLKK